MNIFNVLTLIQFIVLCISAILIGFAKTGMSGISMPAVIILVFFFNGKFYQYCASDADHY